MTAKNADCQRLLGIFSGTSLLWRPTPLPPPTSSPTSLTTPLQSFVPSDRSAGKEGVLESWCHDVPYRLVCLNAWSPGSNPVMGLWLSWQTQATRGRPLRVISQLQFLFPYLDLSARDQPGLHTPVARDSYHPAFPTQEKPVLP